MEGCESLDVAEITRAVSRGPVESARCTELLPGVSHLFELAVIS